MKEKKKARMRDGYFNRKLVTVYFYDGWYSGKGWTSVRYCGDSECIHNGGNLKNVSEYDIFNLGRGCVNSMNDLVKLVKEHCHED